MNKNSTEIPATAWRSGQEALADWRVQSIDRLARSLVLILSLPYIWVLVDFLADELYLVAASLSTLYFSFTLFALTAHVKSRWRIFGMILFSFFATLIVASSRGMSAGMGVLFTLTLCFTALYQSRRSTILVWATLVLSIAGIYFLIVLGYLSYPAEQLQMLDLPAWPRRILVVAAISGTLALMILMLEERLQQVINDNNTLIQELREMLEIKEQESSARKEALQTVSRSQQLESLGHLAGIFAHDICNNLAVIQGSVDILRMRDKNPLFDNIEKASMGAATLSRQLLTLGRHDIAQPKALDVLVELELVHSLLDRAAKRIAVKIETDLATAPIIVDSHQLKQALLNLVTNARDAMNEADNQQDPIRIIVEERAVGGGSPQSHHEAPASEIVITVADAGCGIPEAHLKKVFEPFFTTKEPGKGTGLGLLSVHHFAESNQGRVEIDSDVGGTRISLVFPRTNLAIQDSEAERQYHLEGCRILVVDDDKRIIALLAHLLEVAGGEVFQATSAKEAIQLIEEEQFDLLCTDVVMPRLGGEAVASAFQLRFPGKPILICSAYVDSGAIKGSLRNQELAYLRKPFQATELFDSVTRLLKESGQLPEPGQHS